MDWKLLTVVDEEKSVTISLNYKKPNTTEN